MTLVQLCEEYITRMKVTDTLYNRATELRGKAQRQDPSLITKWLYAYPRECILAQEEASAYYRETKQLIKRIKSHLEDETYITLSDGKIFAR